MTPDQEIQRFARTACDDDNEYASEKYRLALERAGRVRRKMPCFTLKNSVVVRDQRVPRFSLERGEAVSLPLWGDALDSSFLPQLRQNQELTSGRWVSLIPLRTGFFQRYEKWSLWLSRIFGFSRRRARKYLNRAGLEDGRYEFPNERLRLRLLVLDLAHYYQFDLIVPHTGGLDPIMFEAYSERIRSYQKDHAWLFWLENSLTRGSIELESLLPAASQLLGE